jgi:hypothetical protein
MILQNSNKQKRSSKIGSLTMLKKIVRQVCTRKCVLCTIATVNKNKKSYINCTIHCNFLVDK